MVEIASLWNYQESIDELKEKLLSRALEIEAVKVKANEEMKKNTESMKQLLELLKLACHERDEARAQLQNLQIKIMPFDHDQQIFTNRLFPNHYLSDQIHQNPLMNPTKANSGVTESNSVSDSPVDSLFDPVLSPEFSNIHMDTPFFQENLHLGILSNSLSAKADQDTLFSGILSNSLSAKTDQDTLLTESMIQGKALPQKGNMLQTVLEAGPLLQTLLLTGPLPRWRTPPPLQDFHAVCIGMAENPERLPIIVEQPYVEMWCGSSCSRMMNGGANVLNFGDVNFTKRQRLQ